MLLENAKRWALEDPEKFDELIAHVSERAANASNVAPESAVTAIFVWAFLAQENAASSPL